MNKLFFVTSNKGKLSEAKQKFSEINIDIVQKDIGYPEVQADSLEKVSIFGVEHVKERLKSPFILEDAGLFIEALKGFPGVYSSYVYHTIGLDGILRLMSSSKIKDRRAVFRSVFALCYNNEEPRLFIGECLGSISKMKKGSKGFGYDPIFIPEGREVTFAEMDIFDKNSLSHRGKSLNKLMDFVKNI